MTTDFQSELMTFIQEYTHCSSNLIEVLAELKYALLTFDNARLNRILDEKAVLNSEIMMTNEALEAHITARYGEFSSHSSKQMLQDYPQVSHAWGALNTNIKVIKRNLSEIKRVVSTIERYYASLAIPSDANNKQKYRNYYTKN